MLDPQRANRQLGLKAARRSGDDNGVPGSTVRGNDLQHLGKDAVLKRVLEQVRAEVFHLGFGLARPAREGLGDHLVGLDQLGHGLEGGADRFGDLVAADFLALHPLAEDHHARKPTDQGTVEIERGDHLRPRGTTLDLGEQRLKRLLAFGQHRVEHALGRLTEALGGFGVGSEPGHRIERPFEA